MQRKPLLLIGLPLLALALPAPATGQDTVKKADLDAALEKGLTYLRGLQKPDGSFTLPDTKGGTLETSFRMGYTSLSTLTLLKCGTPPGDPSIEKAFQHLYTLPLRRTYSVSLLVLCIEARYAPPKKTLDKNKKKKKKSYVAVARRFFRGQAPKVDKAKLQQCVDYLVKNRSSDQQGAGWRYPSSEAPDQDSSCTQYAMLALKGARRLGANVPITGSGIAALCIAKSELENNPPAWRGRRDAVNQAIRDGCAWLAKYFSPTANPTTGTTGNARTTGWKYYYLYSCERAGVLAGTYRFGTHDWWEEGAAHLIKQQRDEGSWPDAKGMSRLGRTSFALLFLKRATIPLVPLPPKRVMTGGGKY